MWAKDMYVINISRSWMATKKEQKKKTLSMQPRLRVTFFLSEVTRSCGSPRWVQYGCVVWNRLYCLRFYDLYNHTIYIVRSFASIRIYWPSDGTRVSVYPSHFSILVFFSRLIHNMLYPETVIAEVRTFHRFEWTTSKEIVRFNTTIRPVHIGKPCNSSCRIW